MRRPSPGLACRWATLGKVFSTNYCRTPSLERYQMMRYPWQSCAADAAILSPTARSVSQGILSVQHDGHRVVLMAATRKAKGKGRITCSSIT